MQIIQGCRYQIILYLSGPIYSILNQNKMQVLSLNISVKNLHGIFLSFFTFTFLCLLLIIEVRLYSRIDCLK